MRIAIGCDELAYDMKKEIIRRLSLEGVEFIDYGVGPNEKADYPDIAQLVTSSLRNNEADRGILICGTGIGMCISANKVKGIYAAVCHDLYSTQRSILSNDINVMCIGALVVGIATATEMVRTWLSLEFKESPSLRKINKIKEIEKLQLMGANHEK